jgi:hypothetical protein
MKKIKFLDLTATGFDSPKPALSLIPDWYKKQKSYSKFNGKNPPNGGDTVATVKKCIPVFDVMTNGYIISTIMDIYVKEENGEKVVHTAIDPNYVGHHNIKQFEEYPTKDKILLKINNYWGIKTPSGYSCLFIPPAHRENIINILPAIVDTDLYHAGVAFVFTFTDPNFVGYIPAGTPIAQVIPFKREDWTSSFSYSQEDILIARQQESRLRSFFYEGYKRLFWNKKTFK